MFSNLVISIIQICIFVWTLVIVSAMLRHTTAYKSFKSYISLTRRIHSLFWVGINFATAIYLPKYAANTVYTTPSINVSKVITYTNDDEEVKFQVVLGWNPPLYFNKMKHDYEIQVTSKTFDESMESCSVYTNNECEYRCDLPKAALYTFRARVVKQNTHESCDYGFGETFEYNFVLPSILYASCAPLNRRNHANAIRIISSCETLSNIVKEHDEINHYPWKTLEMLLETDDKHHDRIIHIILSWLQTNIYARKSIAKHERLLRLFTKIISLTNENMLIKIVQYVVNDDDGINACVKTGAYRILTRGNDCMLNNEEQIYALLKVYELCMPGDVLPILCEAAINNNNNIIQMIKSSNITSKHVSNPFNHQVDNNNDDDDDDDDEDDE